MTTDTNRKMTSLYVRPELIVLMVLVCLTLTVFLQTRGFEFCNYDDNVYVYENPRIRGGLTARNIAWAFTEIHESNWHPLTWLSHMTDMQLYGTNAGNHHLTSVLLHVLNAILLFTAFSRMTGLRWQSFFLAAVFAIHPLHVESVAWIAERKDILSTFFMLLALNSYVGYAAKPSRIRYLPVLGFFVCGLLSKPMVVTFPVILLLLDYWPLKRLNSETAQPKAAQALLLEKAPLFVCAALSTVVAFAAQLKGGSVASLTDASLQLRVANALVSYCLYLKDFFAPLRLAVFYPFPQDIPFVHILGAGVIMLAITLGVLRKRAAQPWLTVGWLWYIVTLLPVIGIIKIGLQARADRYTYVPLIGIGIGVIWGISFLLKRAGRAMALGVFGGLILIGFLALLSYRQVSYWRSSIALFEHTLSVTQNNFIAHNNLAQALTEKGDLPEAITQCRLALAINPRCEQTYVNLGLAFAQQRDWPQAIHNYRMALELKPEYAIAHNNLGNILGHQGKAAEAIKHFTMAIQSNPDYAEAYNNMGTVFLSTNKPAEARDQFLFAIKINPDYAEAYSNLGNAFTMLKDFDTALIHHLHAVRLLTDSSDIYYNLGNTYALKGMLSEAVSSFQMALQLNPASEMARQRFEVALELLNASMAQ